MASPTQQKACQGASAAWRERRQAQLGHERRVDSTSIAVPLRLVRGAVRYWASYPGEIDAEITAADAAEDAAERAWQRERQLLAR